MSSDRHLKAIERTDLALQGMEDAAIARLSNALESSYRALEKQLRASYDNYSAESLPDLLANQRALLLADELKTLLPIVSPTSEKQITGDFEKLLASASGEGVTLASELMRLTAGDSFVAQNTVVPIQAAAIAADGAYKRLAKHGNDFAEKSTAIITQGLIQGKGAAVVVRGMREQLGVTKGRAEAIVRTETMTAHNQAAQQTYKANGVNFFQSIATADSRTCPTCVGRNMQVLEIGKASVPWHVKCRCYVMPWLPEWEQLGLTDNAWGEKFVSEVEAELVATGKQPNRGLAPFEKANGGAAGKPVWSVQKGYLDESLAPAGTSLLSSIMATGRAAIAELGDKPTAKQWNQFRASLLRGMPKDQAIALAHESGLTEDAAQVAAPYGGEQLYVDVLAEFHQLTAGNIRGFEGFYQGGDRMSADVADRFINVGRVPSKAGLFHELGHFLEADNPELNKAAQQWRNAKATGPKQSLNKLIGEADIYRQDEEALPDHFADPYVGKVYKEGMTEVISMGFERLVSAAEMQRFLADDPDHFAFILGVVKAAQDQQLGAKATGPASSEPLFQGWNGYRQLTPVEEAMQRSMVGNGRELTPVEKEMREYERKRGAEFEAYLKREEEAIARRTSGEIDRKLREYYDEEAAVLRKRLGIPEPKKAAPGGKQTPTSLTLRAKTPALKPIAIKNDLDGITPDTEAQRKAIAVVREYQAIVSEANEALGKIPGEGKVLPPDAYERVYGAINGLMNRLTGVINEAKTLKGKAQNPVLEQYIAAIDKTSKEGLPGYQIRTVNEAIAKNAEVRPC